MQELINKYNTPTPRYTAYPPANYFSEAFTADDYLREVEMSNEQGNPNISIYIHIPFCEQLCFYCGCNSYPKSTATVVENYCEALKQEMRMVLGRLDAKRCISQIHYGGGTPNMLPVQKLAELNQFALSFFKTIDSPEIAIECHPSLLTAAYIDGLKQAGFNRFSIGVQDFDKEVLRTVNRRPAVIPVQEIINQLRHQRPDIAVNLDFIYGLPFQTVSSFTNTIAEAVAMHPDRLVTFSYAHVPWVNKNQKILEKAGLPDIETKTNMYLSAVDVLTKSGYQPIGIDHFVLPGDELHEAQQQGMLHRNFQGYCTRRTTGQVYAFGVSAISQFDHAYAQNTKSIPEYIKAINNAKLTTVKGYRLSHEESAIRTLLTALMCNKGFEWDNMVSQTGYSVEQLQSIIQYDANRLKDFVDDGILLCSDTAIRITDKGNLFTRNVAAALDPLLQQTSKQFSKTI